MHSDYEGVVAAMPCEFLLLNGSGGECILECINA